MRLLVRRRWSDAAWVAGSLALPMSTGLSAGMPRYLFAVYPVFFELDAIFEFRQSRRILVQEFDRTRVDGGVDRNLVVDQALRQLLSSAPQWLGR